MLYSRFLEQHLTNVANDSHLSDEVLVLQLISRAMTAMIMRINLKKKLSFGCLHRNLSVLHFLLPSPPQQAHCDTTSASDTDRCDSAMASFAARKQRFISLFGACTNMRDLIQIHCQIICAGFEQHVFVAGRIITFCCTSEQGSMDYATMLFDQLRWPDGFLWNTMIRGFGRTDRADKAFVYYGRMREQDKVADNFTFCFLLKICAQTNAVRMGLQMHCCVLKHGLGSHIYVANTLINMYSLFQFMEPAKMVFEESPKIDLVSWNSIIAGYTHCGLNKEALRTFLRMQRVGFRPNEVTLAVALSACSELGALHLGRWMHSNLNNWELNESMPVSNSLIDMYAKCGEIHRARQIFEDMKDRNIVSWNSMILGLAMHGHADEAITLFEKMRECELEQPDDITFLGVLCACSHGGLVREGQRYFDDMVRNHKVTPNIRHYGAMVDLLGRAGLVKEAYQLIRSMPMECNAVVWRTLLGACRVHGYIELGEHVRKHLEDLEPEHSSDFVLLSQIYARAGQWNDVLKIRETMKERSIQKLEPGNSSVNMPYGKRVL